MIGYVESSHVLLFERKLWFCVSTDVLTYFFESKSSHLFAYLQVLVTVMIVFWPSSSFHCLLGISNPRSISVWRVFHQDPSFRQQQELLFPRSRYLNPINILKIHNRDQRKRRKKDPSMNLINLCKFLSKIILKQILFHNNIRFILNTK